MDDPDDFTCITQLALLKFWRHEDVEAINLVRKALEIKVDYIPALTLMAELLRFNGHFDSSI